MSNEEKKENTFDKKVVYDEKGDFEIMENEKNKVESTKTKKSLGEKLGKKAEEEKVTPASTGATPLTPAAKTPPLDELDLKNPTSKTGAEPLKPVTPLSAKPEAPKPEPAKVEPAKVEPKPEVKPEPAKVEPKPEIKPEPAKVEPAKVEPKPEPAKVEPAKVEPKPEVKPEAPKPEPAKVEPKEPLKAGSLDKLNIGAKVEDTPKPEPAKAEPKEPLKAGNLDKLNIGAKAEDTPKPESAQPEPAKEPPKEEPKKEVISPFELHPLAEICGKLAYNTSGFIAAVRRNLALLATNPQDRFYAEGFKSLIIHGARLLDDNGNILLHLETGDAGHAIIKVTPNNYQDCDGTINEGQLIMANVGGNNLSLCSMAFSPKLRFMK